MKKLLILKKVKDELPEKSGYYYAVIIDKHPCVVPEIVLLYYSETKTWGGLDKVICWYKEVSEREYLRKIACNFFRWWYNQTVKNIEEGFNKWYTTEYLTNKL